MQFKLLIWFFVYSQCVFPGFFNQRASFAQLVVSHHEGRRKPNDIFVSGFGNHPFRQHVFREAVSKFVWVELHSDKQPFSPNLLHMILANYWGQILLEYFTKPGWVLTHLFFQKHIQSCNCSHASKRVSSVCRSVLSWFDRIHDFVVA